MNKAFVRESDAPPPACPEPQGCGGAGTPVPLDTVRSLLPRSDAEAFASDVFYCVNPACGVAYYDAWGRTVPVTALPVVAWPKDPRGPACPCLGVTADAIIREAGEGRRDAVLRILDHLRSGAAECARLAPDGRSCELAVRRLFLKHRPG